MLFKMKQKGNELKLKQDRPHFNKHFTRKFGLVTFSNIRSLYLWKVVTLFLEHTTQPVNHTIYEIEMHQSQIKCVVLTEKFSLQSNMENMYHQHNI